MGECDVRTRRCKISNGSYGKKRPHKPQRSKQKRRAEARKWK